MDWTRRHGSTSVPASVSEGGKRNKTSGGGVGSNIWSERGNEP